MTINQTEGKTVTSVDFALVNGKLLFSNEIVEAGLAVDHGRIVSVAKETQMPKAGLRINLHGNLILPGVVDSHVHLRDQELAYKEDFTTGTSAAACGGVTTVLDMPNNEPLTASAECVLKRVALADNRALVNVGFYATPFPDRKILDDVAAAGIVAFKLFLSRRLPGIDVEDDDFLRSLFQELAHLHLPVAVHAEDYVLLEKGRKEMVSSGRRDVQSYLQVHSPEVERMAVCRALRLARGLHVKLHFVHVSLGASLTAIQSARRAGETVTAEVTPQHLLLTRELTLRLGPKALADPPLRPSSSRSALWRGLRMGWLDTVASDHAPHSFEEKESEDVWQTRPGFPGLETLLPVLLNEVNHGRLSLLELVRLTSEGPSRIFGLKGRGSLLPGCWADFVIVDPHKESVVDPSRFKSKARFSPFEGMRVRGLPVMTFVNGVQVMEEQEIIASAGVGHIVRGRTME